MAGTDAAVKDGQGYSVGMAKIIENWQGDAKAEGSGDRKRRSCLLTYFFAPLTLSVPAWLPPRNVR